MSIDRREDAGDFYPGGKVISTRPVATGGDVKHSDFAGLDVKTNSIPDLREAVRELGRRLGATVVTALAACVASAATVQTVPVNDLDFDANPSVVTNVVFDAPPDFSTNNTALVETIEATAPAPGNYAAVSNAAMTALQNAKDYTDEVTDDIPRITESEENSGWAADADWAAFAEGAGFAELANHAYTSGGFFDPDTGFWRPYDEIISQLDAATATNALQDAAIAEKQDKLPYPTNAIPYAAISDKPNLATVATSGNYNDLSNKPTIPTVPTNVSAFNNDAGYLTGYTETDPTVPQWAKVESKPTYTASEVGATSPAAVSNIVTTAYVRARLGVYLYVGEDGGIYVHTNEK